MPDRRRAWAAALLAAAPDEARREAFGAALEAIAAVLAAPGPESRALRDFLRDPAVSRERKARLLASAAEPRPGEPPDPVFARFCSLLVGKGRVGLLSAVAASYGAELDRARGEARVLVEAAREPPEGLLRALGEAWAAYSGSRSARVSLRLRPELLAGYRLVSGSIRLDCSLARRAEALGLRLAGGPAAAAGGEG